MRLGRSPNASCDRLFIENVHGPVEPAKAPEHVVRFGVKMAAASDFGALGQYLCTAGCRLQVLPAGAEDRRLRFCF